MSVQKRSEEELRRASGWIFYEYWMVKGLCKRWRDYGEVIEIALTRNAIIDSLLIHSRALVDFFYSDAAKARDSDVVAMQYFVDDGKSWHDGHKCVPDWFGKGLRDKVNNQVAHITYTRKAGEEHRWPKDEIERLERGIDTVMEEFYGLVPKNLLGERWDRVKRERHLSKPLIDSFPDFSSRGGDSRSSFAGEPSNFTGDPTVVDSYVPMEQS